MKVYDLSQVACNVGGQPFNEQVGEIKITQNTKTFTIRTGNDGTATYVKNSDKSHTLTITLFQSSEGNARLSAIYLLALKSAGGVAGIVPIVIKDLMGNSAFSDLECICTGWPEKVYNSELGDCAWEFLCADPERFEGGN